MRYLILAVLFLTACQTTQVLTSPEAPQATISAVVYKSAWDKKDQGSEWTKYTIEALETYGQEMLKTSPKDAGQWCAGFTSKSSDEKKAFYLMLISAMAERESGFKPETSYTEGFKDSSGKAVVSRGLLQISIESANAYGCGFKNSQELHDSKKNLTCGVRILNRWIQKDGYIATAKLGGARYWSVLRDSSSSKAKIQAKVAELCK